MKLRSTQMPLLISLVLLTRIGFADAPKTDAPVIEFLNVEAARKAIVDDTAEPYFSKLAPAEMSAKTGQKITGDTLAAQQAECRKRFQDNVRDFTQKEKDAITWYLKKIDPALRKDYPLFADQPWSFIKTTTKIEFGFSYTRGNHIVLPEGMLERIVAGEDNAPNDSMLSQGFILVHEQTHVMQRAYPQLFAKMYPEIFGFRRAKAIELSDYFKDRQLLNPDGVVCDWIYPMRDNGRQRWLLPLILFHNANPQPDDRDLLEGLVELEKTGVDTFKLKLDEMGEPIITPIRESKQYIHEVGTADNAYHPNELCAELFSRVIVFSLLSDEQRNKIPEEGGLRQIHRVIDPVQKWAAVAFQRNSNGELSGH